MNSILGFYYCCFQSKSCLGAHRKPCQMSETNPEVGVSTCFLKIRSNIQLSHSSSTSASTFLSSDGFPSFFLFSPFLLIFALLLFASFSLFLVASFPPFLPKNLKSSPSFLLVFHDFQLQNTEHKCRLIPSGMCALSLLASLSS